MKTSLRKCSFPLLFALQLSYVGATYATPPAYGEASTPPGPNAIWFKCQINSFRPTGDPSAPFRDRTIQGPAFYYVFDKAAGNLYVYNPDKNELDEFSAEQFSINGSRIDMHLIGARVIIDQSNMAFYHAGGQYENVGACELSAPVGQRAAPPVADPPLEVSISQSSEHNAMVQRELARRQEVCRVAYAAVNSCQTSAQYCSNECRQRSVTQGGLGWDGGGFQVCADACLATQRSCGDQAMVECNLYQSGATPLP
jgi:hypothetical protein